MPTTIKYPVGIQTFEKIRKSGYLYVDKTALIYQLVNENSYVFLSRPRRFGKSLLLSTMEAYFQGRKELFDGLAIAELEKEWKCYPVIRFDFTGESYETESKLVGAIEATLRDYESIYGRDPEDKTISLRFNKLIKNAYNQAGEQVVILIDEYDKPLLDSIHDDPVNEVFRNMLQGFYSNIKKCDEYIRFAMLTGVGKFGHVSIFSGLNNLNDISLLPPYNAICGVSETEFRDNFGPSVENFAKANDMSEADVWAVFKSQYDGYHFSRAKEGLYNPFSILKAFRNNMIDQYWFTSGTPEFLLKIVQRNKYALTNIEGALVTSQDLSDINDPGKNYLALFFQTGYLTIKGYEDETKRFILDFPNEEVRSGFWNTLYRQYVFDGTPQQSFDIFNFVKDIREGRPLEFMTRLQSLTAMISPGVDRGKEIHFQNVMQIIFRLLGFSVHTEVESSEGRCDMLVETPSFIYVMEFKINSSPQVAIQQIKDRGYAAPYRSDGRKVILIGANFSTKTNRLDDFLVEEFN